jgi:hypothetical protein
VTPFAVDESSVQVVWGYAPFGPVHCHVGRPGTRGRARRGGYVGGHDGPGGMVVDGLTPATVYDVAVEGPDGRVERIKVRTLPRPPGAQLSRVATVGDLHLGADRFGLVRKLRDRSRASEPAPVRCARQAVAEAVDWRPDLLVAKGDLTQRGWREQWAPAADVLARAGVATVATLGNHDTDAARETDGRIELRQAGLAVADPVHAVDVPGLRVVVADSTVDLRSRGSLRRALPDLLDALADADRPALVCLHHSLDPWPVPTHYPVGVPWAQARSALRAIRRVKRDVLVTSGHSHRNRQRRAGSLRVSEVASTKDFPGVWAGYTVYEGGIVQMVRRTLAPEAMAWTEQTRRALGGLWAPYAAGRRSDRCFSHRWPR